VSGIPFKEMFQALLNRPPVANFRAAALSSKIAVGKRRFLSTLSTMAERFGVGRC
jgi:hypothetical protein